MENKDADLGGHHYSVEANGESKGKSYLKKLVLFLTVLAVCLAVCLIGLSIYTRVMLSSDAEQKPTTCFSEDCVTSAARMIRAMDKTIDPCDDFYEFACGGWVKDNPVPEWQVSWNQLTKINEGLARDLRELLEDGTPTTGDLPTSVIKARMLYETCMDTDKLEDRTFRSIRHVLSLLKLPTHVPMEWSGEPWYEQAALARRTLDINALLEISVSVDFWNNSRNMLKIKPVSPAISEKYLLDPERFAPQLDAYRKYISDKVHILDPEADEKQFAEDIITFSTSLAKIMTSSEVGQSDDNIDFGSISDFLEEYENSTDEIHSWNQEDWKDYFEVVFKDTNVNLDIKADHIQATDLGYIKELADLLNNTDKLVVEKYLFWSVFSTISSMSLSEFRDLNFELDRAVFGQHQRKPRWRYCSQYVNDNFGHALSYLYVHRHFDESTKEEAIQMLEDVREAFALLVKSLDWMDEETRQRTLDKLTAIRNFVGYPDWLFTPDKLDELYKEMDVMEDELLLTHVELTQAKVKKNLESLRKSVDQNRWISTATIASAFYHETMNSVTLPAAILQKPLHGNGFEAINYGSIGAMVGHEVTHGFDDRGRLFDESGNGNNWWSNFTIKNFKEKAKCIVDQYNHYNMSALPNTTVNGLLTQSENIADNGGIRAAFNAFKLYKERNAGSKSMHLPGMPDYEPDQLFFLGFAQVWCSNTTVEALKSQLVQSRHSPLKIRVIGTLSNSQDFADAWKCPAGSPMNPVHKCVLW